MLTSPPNLLILDLALPDRHGFYMLQALQRCPTACPVIIIASECIEVLRDLNAVNIAGYWRRPLQIAPLVVQLCALSARLRRSPLSGLLTHPSAGDAIDYIGKHYAQPLTVASLARSLRLSPRALSSLFRETTQMTVRDYLARLRIEVVKRRFTGTTDTLEDLAAYVGFCDASYLSRVFRRRVSCWPGEYCRQVRELDTTVSPPIPPTTLSLNVGLIRPGHERDLGLVPRMARAAQLFVPVLKRQQHVFSPRGPPGCHRELRQVLTNRLPP